MKVSVIISTYNSPAWLEKVLWGYECQTYKNFELIIADDGSPESMQRMIEEFTRKSSLEIIYVWQEDRGFQKSQILNKAILSSTSEYLIFSDGDCIPREDFVEVHTKYAVAGSFLSGGYFMLPMETSKNITREDVVNGNAFDVHWLNKNGLPPTYKTLKLTSSGWRERLLNAITPTKATWNGHNSSGWKKDILAVNGFNEQMQYGGQDREMGERLNNYGVKGAQLRYSAICVHLDHKRGYNTKESIKKNKDIRRETKALKKTWTADGILKSEKPIR